MIPSAGCPPWQPDHPRALPRTGAPTPISGTRPKKRESCANGEGGGRRQRGLDRTRHGVRRDAELVPSVGYKGIFRCHLLGDHAGKSGLDAAFLIDFGQIIELGARPLYRDGKEGQAVRGPFRWRRRSLVVDFPRQTAAAGAADSLLPWNSFVMLCAVHTMPHSPLTLSMPRNRNCRKPRACLIWPNTGSGSCLRSR